jgi:hypothetical protein
MKQLIYILLICSGLAFLLLSCDDDPKPNPCAGKQATTAKFTMTEEIDSRFKKYSPLKYWVNYDTDTVLLNDVHFRANLDSTEGTMYQWYIGNKFYVYTREFTIYFGNRNIGENVIPIQLRVKQNITKGCFTNDTTIAQYTRYLVLKGRTYKDSSCGQFCEALYSANSPIPGTYVGQSFNLSENSKMYTDTLVIKFNWINNDPEVIKFFTNHERYKNWFRLSTLSKLKSNNPIWLSELNGWVYMGNDFNSDLFTVYGYKQCTATYYGRHRFILTNGNNNIELYTEENILWFKGTRIKL